MMVRVVWDEFAQWFDGPVGCNPDQEQATKGWVWWQSQRFPTECDGGGACLICLEMKYDH